jgi:molecular chaperone GrpE (heat shock protein)
MEQQSGVLEQLSQDLQKNNDLIDKLYKLIDENSYCKDKLISEIQKKFTDQFLSIIDRANALKKDPKASTDFKLEDLYEELEDFMYSLDIETYEASEGDLFDRRIHSAKESVETDNAELGGKIVKCFSTGYKQNDLIIKAAKVSVYKLIEKTTGEN